MVVLVALAARVVHVVQIQDGPLVSAPILDEKVHHEWAATLAAGEPWSVDRATGEPLPYFRAPLYVWFLGGVYRLFGVDAGLPPRLVQAVLGALGCGLLFLLGRRLFGATTAWIAGLAMALDWLLVVYDGELLIVPLIVLLDVLLALLLVRAAGTPDPRRRLAGWAVSGLVLGLSAIARPNILLYAPAVLAWVLLDELRRARAAPAGSVAPGAGSAEAGPRATRRALLAGAALTVAVLVPILPVTARNWLVGHDRVLIASQGGLNFYIGNNPRSDGVTAVVPGTSPDWWAGYDQSHAMVRQALGREPKESEVSQWFFARGLDFWREDPRAALALTGLKARYLAGRQEWPNNKCLYTFVDEFAPLTGLLPVGFWIVGPLGLLGLVLALREPRRLFPLWGFVLVYAASIVPFFVSARFRAPIVPFLILLGAHALTWLVARARRRDWRALAPALVALAALAVFVNWIPGRGPFAAPRRVPADFLGTLGNELANQGRRQEALEWLERAATEAARALARPDLEPSEAAYLTVIHYSTIYRGAELLEQEGRLPEALQAYRQILPRVPPQARPDLHLRMARILDRLGQPERASEQRARASSAGARAR